MNGADDAAFRRRELDHAWTDVTEHWTDRGAPHFHRHHVQPIDLKARAYEAALHRLLDLLAAAERATD